MSRPVTPAEAADEVERVMARTMPLRNQEHLRVLIEHARTAPPASIGGDEREALGRTPAMSEMAARVLAASRVLGPEASPQGEALETLGVAFEDAAPGSAMDRVASVLLADGGLK